LRENNPLANTIKVQLIDLELPLRDFASKNSLFAVWRKADVGKSRSL
jgi:hypothetical protein